jgi:hypothetical protein
MKRSCSKNNLQKYIKRLECLSAEAVSEKIFFQLIILNNASISPNWQLTVQQMHVAIRMARHAINFTIDDKEKRRNCLKLPPINIITTIVLQLYGGDLPFLETMTESYLGPHTHCLASFRSLPTPFHFPVLPPPPPSSPSYLSSTLPIFLLMSMLCALSKNTI